MSLLSRIAAAMYADNWRQLNAQAVERARRHGYSYTPTFIEFADAPEHVRAMWLGYARAAEKVFVASQWKSTNDLGPNACFHARLRLERSDNMIYLLVHDDGRCEDVVYERPFNGGLGTRYFVIPDCPYGDEVNP